MEQVIIYQIITNCGDGSANTQEYLTYQEAVNAEDEELKTCGYGFLSDTPSAVETYIGSNIHNVAVENSEEVTNSLNGAE